MYGKCFSSAAAGLLAVLLLSAGALADTPPDGSAHYQGVDIYHGTSENGQIDWGRLAVTQAFVYIKADEGENWVDPMYRANTAAAKAHGMTWGTYHFLRLYSADSARQQADNYWARIRGTGYTLIPAVDVESCDGQQSAADMRAVVRAFVDEFRAVSGITPVLYTYTSYASDILRGQFADCPLWLADYRGYAGDVVGWGSWQAWQYSEHGSVDAIANGEVDLDHATAGIWLNPGTARQTTAVSVAASETTSARGDPAVLAMQQTLNRLGIPRPALAEDGVGGAKTRSAVQTLERVAGIAVDAGIYGSQCRAAVSHIDARPTLRQGSTGQVVRYLQYRLGVAVDGSFGPATRAAAAAWQRTHGLAADGIVGPATWAALLG